MTTSKKFNLRYNPNRNDTTTDQIRLEEVGDYLVEDKAITIGNSNDACNWRCPINCWHRGDKAQTLPRGNWHIEIKKIKRGDPLTMPVYSVRVKTLIISNGERQ
jgi:hypothetical protein